MLDSFIFSGRDCFTSYGGEKIMAKKGTKYKCEECGLVVVVDEACGCSSCDLICCDEPMKEVKPKAKK
jgi:hypothetical protein